MRHLDFNALFNLMYLDLDLIMSINNIVDYSVKIIHNRGTISLELEVEYGDVYTDEQSIMLFWNRLETFIRIFSEKYGIEVFF